MDCSQTKLLLRQYYNINSDCIPQQREKSKWKPENNVGFLLGITAFGINTHRTQLHSLLVSSQFEDQENSFIDSMFEYYIRPFHKSYNTDSESCHTPSTVSSRTPSRSNSVDDLHYVPELNELLHKDLKKAVVKRDVVCLFCWNRKPLKGSHIIAQKNVSMAYNETSLFIRAGITQKHEVQNGLLLCGNCHDEFDLLKRYVDFIDDKLVVKVVNETNDENDVNYRSATKGLKGSRRDQLEFVPDNRQPIETNGEMALYFVQNNPTKLPNREALEFHKVACMIWRMAGGAETDEEYCSDDEDLVPVDTTALKRRFKVQYSAETLNIVS
jgi:HNH endonuclease